MENHPERWRSAFHFSAMELIPYKVYFMDIDKSSFYKMIAPRPTVCVCTKTPSGTRNIGPYSFVMPVSFNPPLIAVSVGKGKDSLLNARETGSFVVAPVTADWRIKGIRTEVKLEREQSEFDEIGLEPIDSSKVDAPSVKDAPINIECNYWDDFECGDHSVLVGEVVAITAKEGSINNQRLNIEDLGSVGHIGGEEFCISDSVTIISRD